MTLISHEYGCRFSHSRTYLISTTHSSLISLFCFSGIVFVLDIPNTQSLLRFKEHYRRMLRFASLADFLKVLLITTWSPSSARWQIFVSLSPEDDLGEKPAKVFFTVIKDRSEPKQTLHTPSKSHFYLIAFFAISSVVSIRHGVYSVTLLSPGTYL